MSSLDQVQINASGDGLIVLKICLAFILFSLAIDIKKEDFITLYSNPKSVIVGCISQIIILPLFTFILVLLLKPSASIALGMLLVAACPCGNMSTYMSYLAKRWWPSLLSKYSTRNSSSFFYLLSSIFLLLVLPLITGIALKAYFPRFIDKINKPVKISALLFFIALLMGAFITNRNVFYEHLPEIFGIICLQNFLAFIIGYFFSKLFKLPETHCRSISIETGIHNSGLYIGIKKQ